MYSHKIFEIFKNPSNAGGLQGSNGIGKYVDEICGDFVKIYLKIDDEQIITEARFKTMGSVGTIVASSALCSLVVDSSLAEAQELTAEDILEVTGEYPLDKMYSLDFAIRGLNLAIADYYQKIEKDDKPKRKKSEDKKTKAKKVKEEPIAMDLNQDIEDELDIIEPKEEVIETTVKAAETTKEYKKEEVITQSSKQEFFDFYDEEEQTSVTDETNEDRTEDLSLDELQEEEDQEYLDEDDLEYDEFGYPYIDNDDYDHSQEVKEKEQALDPVDLFLRGGDSGLEIHNLSSGDRISITTTTEETVNIKATRMVEESKTFTPIVETKIISDEEMKKLSKGKKEEKSESKVSKAKAMFDAMFEE